MAGSRPGGRAPPLGGQGGSNSVSEHDASEHRCTLRERACVLFPKASRCTWHDGTGRAPVYSLRTARDGRTRARRLAARVAKGHFVPQRPEASSPRMQGRFRACDNDSVASAGGVRSRCSGDPWRSLFLRHTVRQCFRVDRSRQIAGNLDVRGGACGAVRWVAVPFVVPSSQRPSMLPIRSYPAGRRIRNAFPVDDGDLVRPSLNTSACGERAQSPYSMNGAGGFREGSRGAAPADRLCLPHSTVRWHRRWHGIGRCRGGRPAAFAPGCRRRPSLSHRTGFRAA